MQEITNIEKFAEAIKSAQNILIVVNSSYSFDELAAALTLGLSLEKSGKKIILFSPRQPLVEDASLFGVSNIKNKFGSGNLIISIPDALTSVDKVTHYLEGDRLNIVVHPIATANKLATDRITISAQEETPDLAIFVNTSFSKFVNTLNTQEQKNYSDVIKFVIGGVFSNLDNEISISPIENVCFSETVTWILEKLNLPFDADCASNLFQGMKTATNFVPPRARASTFKAASICLEKNPIIPETKTSQQPNVTQAFVDPKVYQQEQNEQKTKVHDDLFPKDLPGLLKTPKTTIGKTNVDQDDYYAQDENSQVPSDWTGPKILKSSGKNINKT